MKATAAEFAVPDVVPEGKYAGTRIADLPTEDLSVVLREHRRLPQFARAIDFELRRRRKRRMRPSPPLR
jgi:uncharacterized protein (DUF3820 family)